MGTRNSTLVKLNGELKVAQYGQWDGYPTGQGETIAEFLRTADLKKFKEQLKSVKPIDEKEVSDWCKENEIPDWMTSEQAEKFHARFPGINRDHGAGILNLIYDGKVTEVRLAPEFREDGVFCEYWYEINLDDETVTIGGRINKKFTFAEFTKEGLMEELEKEENEE